MSIIIFWVCLVLFLFLAYLDLIFNSWMKILFLHFIILKHALVG